MPAFRSGFATLISALLLGFAFNIPAYANLFGNSTPVGLYAATSSSRLDYWAAPSGNAVSTPAMSGVGQLFGIDFTPDGTLYGVERPAVGIGSSFVPGLFSIDPSTGSNHRIGDAPSHLLAIDRQGNAFGLNANGLIKINLSNASSTLVTSNIFDDGHVYDLAFDNTGRLWTTNVLNHTVTEYDAASGALLRSLTLSPLLVQDSVVGIAFSATNQMYVTIMNINVGDPPSLYSVNQTTGAAQFLGTANSTSFPNEYSFNLAIFPSPEPASVLVLGISSSALFLRRRVRRLCLNDYGL